MTKEEGSVVDAPRVVNPERFVHGKAVLFRSRYPVKENSRVGKLLNAALDGDTEKQIALLRAVVERWDFDGDPGSRRSYDELDGLFDVMPMVEEFAQFIVERRESSQKN